MKLKKRQKIRKALILISFILFPVTINYFSPVLIIMGASKGIVSGSFFVFGTLFASSLFFGRFFCGWLCPGSGLQEACAVIVDRPVKRGYWIRYLIWIPWLSTIIFLFIKSGGILQAEPLFQTEDVISVMNYRGYIVLFGFITIIVLLAFIVGKRSFCHHVCWIGPFMLMGRIIRNTLRWPSLRLRADTESCISCILCNKNCPMDINVEAMVKKGDMETGECILCGMCADVCPKGTISYSFSRG